VVATTDLQEACSGVEVAVMVGGFPRKAGMERKDVMAKNVSIYATQARALEQHASRDVKVSQQGCYMNGSCALLCTICLLRNEKQQ
jgi:malate/lactate dehydrogenase